VNALAPIFRYYGTLRFDVRCGNALDEVSSITGFGPIGLLRVAAEMRNF
jgi:hypothetical protein